MINIVYVSIGNSDDKLSQMLWSEFAQDVVENIREWCEEIFGVWFSTPDSAYQNACVAFSIEHAAMPDLRKALTVIRKHYEQDSVAWAEVSETEFI